MLYAIARRADEHFITSAIARGADEHFICSEPQRPGDFLDADIGPVFSSLAARA